MIPTTPNKIYDDVVIESIELSQDGTQYIISGENFTQWSRVYIDNNKIKPTYISGNRLAIDATLLKNGDTVVVSQVGSNNTRFRDSNEFAFILEESSEIELTQQADFIEQN